MITLLVSTTCLTGPKTNTRSSLAIKKVLKKKKTSLRSLMQPSWVSLIGLNPNLELTGESMAMLHLSRTKVNVVHAGHSLLLAQLKVPIKSKIKRFFINGLSNSSLIVPNGVAQEEDIRPLSNMQELHHLNKKEITHTQEEKVVADMIDLKATEWLVASIQLQQMLMLLYKLLHMDQSQLVLMP